MSAWVALHDLKHESSPNAQAGGAISTGLALQPLRQPEQSRQSYDDWAVEKTRRATPPGRWQEPHDIAAAAAVFLASPLAKNITGQTLNVDGGQVMHS